MQLFHASLFVCSKSFVSGLDNLGQTQYLMAATPEAGARAARTRAQWMSAVKRNALKREYENEDPVDDEENEETLDEATSNCRRRTSLMREWASRVHLQRSLLQQMQPCENKCGTTWTGLPTSKNAILQK